MKALMLLLLLFACQPADRCADFGDIAITNPDGAASAGVVDTVRAAVDEFAGWSSADGVCVDEIELVEEVDSGRDGKFDFERIQVEYGASYVDYAVRHELCYAADYQAGRASKGHPNWFGDAPVETFAERCDNGPRDTALATAVGELCGADLGAARQDWINAEVYGAAVLDGVPPVGTLDISLRRSPITGLPDGLDWSAVAGGTAVYDLSRAFQDGAWVYSLVQVIPGDPIARVTALPAGGPYDLLPSDAGPVLVAAGEPTTAWQFDEAGGALVAVPFPELEEMGAAAVMDGAVWGWMRASREDAQAFSRVDLATGARTVLDGPEGIDTWSPFPDRGVLAGNAVTDEGEHVWLVYTPETGTWAQSARGSSVQRVTLADGRVLGWWGGLVGSDGWELAGLAVSDGSSGDWWLPDSPCGGDAIGRSVALLSVGGDPWLWEYPNGWKPDELFSNAGHLLTWVEVAP